MDGAQPVEMRHLKGLRLSDVEIYEGCGILAVTSRGDRRRIDTTHVADYVSAIEHCLEHVLSFLPSKRSPKNIHFVQIREWISEKDVDVHVYANGDHTAHKLNIHEANTVGRLLRTWKFLQCDPLEKALLAHMLESGIVYIDPGCIDSFQQAGGTNLYELFTASDDYILLESEHPLQTMYDQWQATKINAQS